MARDVQGRYWYKYSEVSEGSYSPEYGYEQPIVIHAQPGEPGAFIGGAPHEGSLDSFIAKAIPLAIGSAVIGVLDLAIGPFAQAIIAPSIKGAAREAGASDRPIGVAPMWEDEGWGDFVDAEWGEVGDFAGGFVGDIPIEGEGGTSIYGQVGQYLGGMASIPGILRSTGSLGGIAAGAAGAGLVSLGAKLGRMFGRSGGTFIINGVRGSMASLWPLTRKYGAVAVAAALGITTGALGEMLAMAPTGGGRKRARGISARDLRTTARVGRFNKRINRLFGTGRSRGRSYRPRGRGAHYH